MARRIEPHTLNLRPGNSARRARSGWRGNEVVRPLMYVGKDKRVHGNTNNHLFLSRNSQFRERTAYARNARTSNRLHIERDNDGSFHAVFDKRGVKGLSGRKFSVKRASTGHSGG